MILITVALGAFESTDCPNFSVQPESHIETKILNRASAFIESTFCRSPKKFRGRMVREAGWRGGDSSLRIV